MRRGLAWTLLGFVLVALLSLGGTLASGNKILLGLDLKGGVSVVLAPARHIDTATLQQAVNIIERRVNGLGVSNAEVERQGDDVVISLPGIKNSQSALKTLGTTAELYFRPLYCQIADYSKPPSSKSKGASITSPEKASAGLPAGAAVPARLDAFDEAGTRAATSAAGTTTTPTTSSSTATTAAGATTATTATPGTTTATTAAGATTTTTPGTTTTTAPSSAASGSGKVTPVPTTVAEAQSDCAATNTAQIPSTSADNVTAKDPVIVPASADSGYSGRFILGPADLTGRAVKTAYVALPQGSGTYAVELTLTGSGTKAFNKMAAVRNQYYSATATTPDPRSLEAIELDGVLESAPAIEESNYDGTAQITGDFTESQASNLALELKYGSLPVRFTPQQVQTVSASIGEASLRAGLLAGLGGIVVVLLYMVVYYRALGLVVAVGLALGGSILYSVLVELSQSSSLALTLAGVTGIIVSIGITVDSYVVYFERLKDEVRSGRTVRQSVERSFARAFRTVLTADTVSFLAALVLWFLTVGDVRGFAFTLGLSTLLDVFTAYFFIRPAVILLGRRRAFTEAPILGVSRGLGANTRAGADA